ncbi:MAG: DUF998 domain-containing protein [Patescibacteria group bacterium]
MNIAFIFALLGFLAYISEGGVLLWLHIKPTGYHPIRNAVSDYGVGPTHRLLRIYLWLCNLGAVFLTIALIVGLRVPPIPQRSIVFLFLLVGVRICLSLFPTDLEGKPMTRTGILHYIFAVLTIGFVYTIMAQLTPFFQARPDWQAINRILGVLLTITTPALIAIVITMWKPLRSIFGLFERIFIVSTTLWFLIVSAFLAISLY